MGLVQSLQAVAQSTIFTNSALDIFFQGWNDLSSYHSIIFLLYNSNIAFLAGWSEETSQKGNTQCSESSTTCSTLVASRLLTCGPISSQVAKIKGDNCLLNEPLFGKNHNSKFEFGKLAETFFVSVKSTQM